jgi:hypothetical protein
MLDARGHIMRWVNIPVGITVVMLGASAALAQRPFEVTWAGERLTVRAAEAPRAGLLDEVARLTGIEVVGREKLAGRVTVDVADASIDQGLAKILEGVNYVLLERPGGTAAGGRQLVVRVHSMAGAPLSADIDSGPIHVPALDALVASEAEDEADLQEIDEDDPDVDEDTRAERVQAARLTGQGAFGTKADVASLLKLSENYYNDFVRLAAIKALGSRQGPAVVGRLAKALGDEAAAVRNAAVEILGRHTDTGSLRMVGQLLEQHDDRDVRVCALRVLAMRGAPEAAPHLKSVLKDPDPSIREAAGQLLAELERREQSRQAAAR